jgi:hypothetical protein
MELSEKGEAIWEARDRMSSVEAERPIVEGSRRPWEGVRARMVHDFRLGKGFVLLLLRARQIFCLQALGNVLSLFIHSA